MMPMLVQKLESKFHNKAIASTGALNDTVLHLQTILQSNFCRKQTLHIRKLVSDGILYAGLDWGTISATKGIFFCNHLEIRQHCYHLLLHLVMVHAKVNEVSKELIHPILSQLVQTLVQELLYAYRLVNCFSPSGMLQATLETEFLHTILKLYETPASAVLFTQVYDTIEKATKSDNLDDSTKMNTSLMKVKMFLEQAKRTTQVQFLCFKEHSTKK